MIRPEGDTVPASADSSTRLKKTTNNDERQSPIIAPSEPLQYVFKKEYILIEMMP